MSDSENAVISGAQAGLRVLTDGTVRLTVDIEPKDRVAAMKLFGAPGQPMALAALRDGHAAAKDDKPAGWNDLGPICREAIDLCDNPQFHRYVAHVLNPKADKDLAPPSWWIGRCKQFIQLQCNVESRKELDADEGARERFITHVRKPFHAWLEKQRAG